MRPPTWAALLDRNTRLMRRSASTLGERYRPPPGAGSWLMGLVMAADGPRRYYLFRPAGVRFGEKLPLLVMLHGCHQDARTFAASTRMNALAARERFLVLYPEQPRVANPQGCWHWFDVQGGRARHEMAWILRAIAQVGVLYAADGERTAVAGLSAGAGMAGLLATHHPERFRAVVMHSGVPPGVAESPAAAPGAMRGQREPLPPAMAGPWPPLLVIHGDGDRIVSSRNAAAAARLWAAQAGAQAGQPRLQQRGARHPMTVTQYRRQGRLAATWVEVHGLGHAWSGGAARQRFGDAQGPDATRMAWRFIARALDTHPG